MLDFNYRLNAFIILKLDHQYRDPKNFHFLTFNHENKAINYINMVAKWYISKQFQNQLKLDWLGYKRFTKLVITGEKPHITNIIRSGLPSVLTSTLSRVLIFLYYSGHPVFCSAVTIILPVFVFFL